MGEGVHSIHKLCKWDKCCHRYPARNMAIKQKFAFNDFGCRLSSIYSLHASDMSHICYALSTVMSFIQCGRKIPKQKNKEVVGSEGSERKKQRHNTNRKSLRSVCDHKTPLL